MTTFVLDPKSPNCEAVRANLHRFIDGLSREKAWEIESKVYSSRRSVKHCRYLNGVAYRAICEATGYDRDDVSEYLCGLYFGTVPKRKPGKRIEDVPLRTTTTDEHGNRSVQTKPEFTAYVEFVKRFAAEHNIAFPDPPDDIYGPTFGPDGVVIE